MSIIVRITDWSASWDQCIVSVLSAFIVSNCDAQYTVPVASAIRVVVCQCLLARRPKIHPSDFVAQLFLSAILLSLKSRSVAISDNRLNTIAKYFVIALNICMPEMSCSYNSIPASKLSQFKSESFLSASEWKYYHKRSCRLSRYSDFQLHQIRHERTDWRCCNYYSDFCAWISL